MWTYLDDNSELVTYSPAQGAESSPISSSATFPSALSKLIPTAETFSSPASATGVCPASQSGTTLEPLTGSRGADMLTSSLEGSHAPTSARQEEAPASPENSLGSGWRWPESFARFDRDSSSWRTRQFSLLGVLEPYSATWPRWGTMRDGECSALTMPELRTSESGFGSLLPTPTAQSGGYNRSKSQGRVGPIRPSLEMMARHAMWPTPRASARENRQTKRTPSQEAGHHGLSLAAEAGGPLNPTWVELLMGWPMSWTDLNPMERGELDAWIEGFSRQGMRDLSQKFQSQAHAERATSGSERIFASETLQPDVREQQEISKNGYSPMEGEEAQKTELRSMRRNQEESSSSLRPGSDQQRYEQPADPVSMVPRLLACYGKEAWSSGSWENATPRVMHGVASRVERLRALGNGQVPSVAALAWSVLTNDIRYL